jgi:hypothetical protein
MRMLRHVVIEVWMAQNTGSTVQIFGTGERKGENNNQELEGPYPMCRGKPSREGWVHQTIG